MLELKGIIYCYEYLWLQLNIWWVTRANKSSTHYLHISNLLWLHQEMLTIGYHIFYIEWVFLLLSVLILITNSCGSIFVWAYLKICTWSMSTWFLLSVFLLNLTSYDHPSVYYVTCENQGSILFFSLTIIRVGGSTVD